MKTVKPTPFANRSDRFAAWLRRAALALGLGAASMASVAQVNTVELPDLGASADRIATPAEEAAYAQALVRQMRAYDVLVEDPIISEFFSHMGYRLVSQSPEPHRSFRFVVLDQNVVNAFAAPGGVVALYSGMILAAEREDSIASVLAHEIAHVTQQHVFRGIEQAQAMTIPTMLAMLGIALAGGGSGQAIQGAIAAGQGLAAQAQINYTRQNEAEADRIGIQTLYDAGYDPDGQAEMFEMLGRVSRPNGEGPPEYLRTHPLSISRVADAKNRAHNMPEVEPGDGRLFYLVRARLRALTSERPETALSYFQHELDRDTELTPAKRDAHLYGMAITEQRRHRFDAAADLLGELADREPNQLLYQLQLADLDLDRGRPESAQNRLGRLYHSFPGNHAIAVQYAETLLAQGSADKAETASVILRQQLLSHQADPRLHELYARAANQAGDHVRATEAMAESYYQRGGIHEAVIQLEKLHGRQDLDYYERARVAARLTELRVQMLENARG